MKIKKEDLVYDLEQFIPVGTEGREMKGIVSYKGREIPVNISLEGVTSWDDAILNEVSAYVEKNSFAVLHFIEDNVPYGDDTLEHDIYIKTLANEEQISSLLSDISSLKDIAEDLTDILNGECLENVDEEDYEEFSEREKNIIDMFNAKYNGFDLEDFEDLGWQEKIDRVARFLISKMSDTDIIEATTFSTLIN